jgi:hypothetical protein
MKRPLDYEAKQGKKQAYVNWEQIGGKLLGIIFLVLILVLFSWWRTGSPYLLFFFMGGK